MLKFGDFDKNTIVRFLDVPEFQSFHIKPDPSVASKLGLGTDAHRDYIERHAVKEWAKLTEDFHAQVLNYGVVPIHARHKHSENETDAERQAHCLGCIVEKKQAEGRPIVRINVNVMRDVQPVELVESPVIPRQHKKKRWMSETYHNRIQKKWNKKVVGLTTLKPRQEQVIISMTKAAFRAISDHFRG